MFPNALDVTIRLAISRRIHRYKLILAGARVGGGGEAQGGNSATTDGAGMACRCGVGHPCGSMCTTVRLVESIIRTWGRGVKRWRMQWQFNEELLFNIIIPLYSHFNCSTTLFI